MKSTFGYLSALCIAFLLFACAQPAGNQGAHMKDPEMKTYMIVTATISDRDGFINGYGKAAGALVEKFGGRYVLRGPGAKLLEHPAVGTFGDGASMVISEWPDRETVERFWNSDEYKAAKKLREGMADVQVLIIDAPKFTKDDDE